MQLRRPVPAWLPATMCALVLLASRSAPSRPADFAGSYAGEDVKLELRADPKDPNSYTGTVTADGRAVPVRGSFDAVKGFHGTVDLDGKPTAYSLRQTPEGVVVTIEGGTYELK